jgi:large subunit ribosomal protein L25
VSAEALKVEKREETGTLRMRRMRQAGMVPAVLYGHGQECLNLKVDQRHVRKMVDHGHYIVALSGAVSETAMIKEVQWDAFGSRILHLDLARVDATEKVEATLPLNVKGEAPGSNMGGIVTQVGHEIKIMCPANVLPDFLEVSIDELQLDGSITVADVAIPAGAEYVTDAAETLITCAAPRGAKTDDGEDAATEPEVIGKGPGEEGAE